MGPHHLSIMNIVLDDVPPSPGPDLTRPESAWGVSPTPWLWRPGTPARQAWQAWARQVAQWLNDENVLVRDAVILLPQVALLNHARQAWREVAQGWMPRFETAGTLLERLPQRPTEVVKPTRHAVTLDEALDRLLASARMAQEPGGRSWRARDRLAFHFAAEQMVAVAHAWLKVALSQPPGQRGDWVNSSRLAIATEASLSLEAALSRSETVDLLDAQTAAHLRAGRTERWLVEQAVAWAAESLASLAARRDALFTAAQASAWVAVTAGDTVVPGTDSALMLALLQQGQSQGLPVCWTPAVLDVACDVPDLDRRPALFEAAHGADEAEVAAALVLDAVQQIRAGGQVSADPVALLAQDRVLTRRVRALLAPHERAGTLVMADESGWTLSTTRAAAAVTRLLAATAAQARSDDLLDWLVEGWCDGVPGGLFAVGALETVLRKQGRLNVHGLTDVLPAGHPAIAILAWATQTLAPLRALASRGHFSLMQGLEALGEALTACGALQPLKADAAGQSVLKALRLEIDAMGDVQTQNTWLHVCAQVSMSHAEFIAWVEQTLEGANFMPPPPERQPDLVITPLTRAVLRPFSAVIAPGSDERQLGRAPSGQWLSSAQVARLGLGTLDQQQASQWGAWAVLCTQPGMMALARRLREGEPVAPSAWLSRWLHELGAAPGQDGWRPLADPRIGQTVQATGVQRAEPALKAVDIQTTPDPLAPRQISATSYEQLRACPYRFFARSLLGLSPLDELDEGIEASETGTWLHEALKRFHEARGLVPTRRNVDEDVALFVATAEQVADSRGLRSVERKAHFAPWLITLPGLAAHYVHWLHGIEQEGWLVHAQEQRMTRQVFLPALPGSPEVTMHGHLDRVDRQMSAQGTAWQVLDYKTGSLKGLLDRVKSPDEDTQLAFYAALAEAALLASRSEPADRGLSALYLRVADDQTKSVPHPDAETSAHRLVQGLGSDMTRIWQGHGMPALGEGMVCEHCEVRGLCRKDHWAPVGDVQPGGVA